MFFRQYLYFRFTLIISCIICDILYFIFYIIAIGFMAIRFMDGSKNPPS
ncbi:protein of unknown function [Xenorhabdus bovienii]|uniref:Uncharacterized protein n=1 Tax=Xenorhabdus bovienii TaxID=40576 RepID=A0A0B6XF84_XENBV|nr:protein of unknown function [Xenorhabdus bovienii]